MEDWILVYSNNNKVFFINENLTIKKKERELRRKKMRNKIINEDISKNTLGGISCE